jgi:Cdc6-like AAA superfamily ATPase
VRLAGLYGWFYTNPKDDTQMATLFAMEAQQGFTYPKTLAEEFKPARIADFVGLEKQRKIMANLVKNPRPCALLFRGATGTGKTSLAYAFANELSADVWHVGSQDCKVDRLKEVSARCWYVPSAGLQSFHVVIVDEADKMSDASQLYLLSKLDGSEPCPNTIWIFTCNSTDGLEKRFLDRCIPVPDFNTYGASEAIAELLARVWQAKAPSATAPNFKKLASGSVRESLQRLESELLAV